eukprot:TRINITY_DN2834_c0_g1_i1.p1 TRINITY_DN2834_c0_g1~~TRINITY_DN2834_c0_g1_i1.p1  ORF type:complete len:449 (+),score=112.52 TRINITY_DN2834_c0_g1_i1:67-1413(+)
MRNNKTPDNKGNQSFFPSWKKNNDNQMTTMKSTNDSEKIGRLNDVKPFVGSNNVSVDLPKRFVNNYNEAPSTTGRGNDTKQTVDTNTVSADPPKRFMNNEAPNRNNNVVEDSLSQLRREIQDLKELKQKLLLGGVEQERIQDDELNVLNAEKDAKINELNNSIQQITYEWDKNERAIKENIQKLTSENHILNEKLEKVIEFHKQLRSDLSEFNGGPSTNTRSKISSQRRPAPKPKPVPVTIRNFQTNPVKPLCNKRLVISFSSGIVQYNIDSVSITYGVKLVQGSLYSSGGRINIDFIPPSAGNYEVIMYDSEGNQVADLVVVAFLPPIPITLQKTDQIGDELWNGCRNLLQSITDVSVVPNGGILVIVSSAVAERVEQYFDAKIDTSKCLPLVVQRVTAGTSPKIIDPWGNLVIVLATGRPPKFDFKDVTPNEFFLQKLRELQTKLN